MGALHANGHQRGHPVKVTGNRLAHEAADHTPPQQEGITISSVITHIPGLLRRERDSGEPGPLVQPQTGQVSPQPIPSSHPFLPTS